MKPLHRTVNSAESVKRAIEAGIEAIRTQPAKYYPAYGIPAGTPFDLAVALVKEQFEKSANAETWMNEKYTVQVRTLRPPENESDPGLVHISIRRNDRAPSRDWRDFQAIKNQVLGPDCEAVEMYPAESRVADVANQYHLWGFPNPKFRLPFGFGSGARLNAADAVGGSVQRDH